MSAPSEQRFATRPIRRCACRRLQTFPNDVNIVGTPRAVQKQVVDGSVTSLLAEVLGRAIRSQLLKMRQVRIPLKLLPSKLQTVPPPRRPTKVARKYLAVRGEHKAHPGTGQGNAALAREVAL